MNKLGGTHQSKQDRNIIRDALTTNKTCHEIALLVGKGIEETNRVTEDII